MPNPVNPIADDIVYGRQALRNGEPWIVPAALTALEQVLQDDWMVFEWGSGGSTVYWARRCKFVVSVEHNQEWLARTHELLRKLAAPRNRVQLMWFKRGEDDTFKEYASAIEPWPPAAFDLVYVDGEASSRGWCLTAALPRVKLGGYLLLDNSDWLKRDLGDGWERQDFVERGLHWVGQDGTFDWWTSLLRKVKV